jgi:hypothetical protein
MGHESTATIATATATATDGVEVGSAIFALHDPHRGHERAFNRYYERDHQYAGGVMAPWTIAAGRWVATRELKALRYPDPGPFGPATAGSYLTMFWIQAGRLADQQRWVAEQMPTLAAAGRTYDHRDVQTATAYDHLGAVERDPDGVPPFLALDHGYPGAVWAVLERAPAVALDDVVAWLLDDHLPALVAGTSIAIATCATPRPKEPWWPAAAPDVPGVGERVMVTCFLDDDPRACWGTTFVGWGAELAASGRARALLVAPFVPTVVGTDRYTDELW